MIFTKHGVLKPEIQAKLLLLDVTEPLNGRFFKYYNEAVEERN